MTRISASDHIIILLRQKLERAAALKKGGKSQKSGELAGKDGSNIHRVRALAQMEALGDEDIDRSLVQGLLLEEFGEALVNDPKFQQLVSRIVDLLANDDAGKALLGAARRDLRE